MKRTIEIEDWIPGAIEEAKKEIQEKIQEYLKENDGEAPEWGDLDDDGSMHEIIDGSVSIWTDDQKNAWYLYGDKAEEAFESQFGADAKRDEGWPMGWKAAALYCYIEQELVDWFDDYVSSL